MQIISDNVFTEIPWIALNPRITSTAGARNAVVYSKAIEQFRVETNPRYRPRDGKTYCNIFVWDVTRAMGCELPHWARDDGTPALPTAPGAQRMNCNALYEWLFRVGQRYGWCQIDEQTAIGKAQRGMPTVGIWTNPSGNGHIAMVLAGSRAGAVLFAQAGRTCFSCGGKEEAFQERNPEYWSHA